ncbi:uncharacterized protein [Onthophagus taurus]|uniref:uncharacterized protein n=1 Tax=Onthophagus taurus TaxID=166361 RepID=UPI000C20F98A|nr:uncharacterized protein LOC111428584 [Onthophagus taurus]
MKIILALLFVLLALANCQYFGFQDFPSNAFSGGLDSSYRSARDPRQDRGPVVFPQAPSDNGETSGVVVGASGYGFVPPSSNYRSFY